MTPDLREPGALPEPAVHRETWSRNGEVCIAGLDPPFAGGARLASCLTWLLRSFASDCRRTHDATGAHAFTCTSPRMPSTLALSMAMSFDLALRDPQLIRARVLRRGGYSAGHSWPALWLEGSAYEYMIGRDPFPTVGTPRRKLVLLADERQALLSARGSRVGAAVHRAWATGLDAVAGVDDDAVRGLLEEDEHGFALNVLVLVHAWPARAVHPRPGLKESYRRHESVMAMLSAPAEAKGLAVAWHALWRLPPAMTWSEAGETPWMRYPAVSFATAVRRLHGRGDGRT